MFLNDNNFGSLLKQVIFDTTVFGVSFVEKTRSTPMLTRIDPTSAEAKVGPRRERGGGAFFLQVLKVLKYQPDGSTFEVSRNNLINFTGEHGLDHPTGHSAFGMWLHLWFSLRLAPQALLNTSFMGMKETKDLDWLREYAENSVITGSGVPKFVVKPETIGQFSPTARKFLENSFSYSTKFRRKDLSRQIEEKIFPLALGRAYDFDHWPTFVWLD